MTRALGRPRIFQCPAELQDRIEDYFKQCEDNNKAPGVCSLAVFLGTNRQTLLNYEQEEDFGPVIRQAKARVEAYLEEQLMDPFRKNVTGVIFNLKNNFRWRDKHEVAVKSETMTVMEMMSVSDDELQERILDLEQAIKEEEKRRLLKEGEEDTE